VTLYTLKGINVKNVILFNTFEDENAPPVVIPFDESVEFEFDIGG
jgi:hypothetical protein